MSVHRNPDPAPPARACRRVVGGAGGGGRPRRSRAALVTLLAAFLCAGCAARAGPQGEPLSEDERIAADVRGILRDEEGIVSEDIEVEVRAGVVVLSGVQPALEPVSEALQRISRVRGVLEVVNRIRIQRAASRMAAGS